VADGRAEEAECAIAFPPYARFVLKTCGDPNRLRLVAFDPNEKFGRPGNSSLSETVDIERQIIWNPRQDALPGM
jgi:hypothetical protein